VGDDEAPTLRHKVSNFSRFSKRGVSLLPLSKEGRDGFILNFPFKSPSIPFTKGETFGSLL